VGAADGSSAKFDFAAGNAGGLQYIQAYRGARDINDRIKRAHLVESYIICRDAVYPAFRPRDAGKNIQSAFFRSPADTGLFNKGADFLPGIVGMPAMMFMTVPVMFMRMTVFVPVVFLTVMIMLMRITIFGIMVFVPVRMFVFMPVMIMRMTVFVRMMMSVSATAVKSVPDFNYGPCSRNTAAIFAHEFQFPSLKSKFIQPGAQFSGIDAQIDKSAQRHITGNSGGALKMQCSHIFVCIS
jgi:hypothetical protein